MNQLVTGLWLLLTGAILCMEFENGFLLPLTCNWPEHQNFGFRGPSELIFATSCSKQCQFQSQIRSLRSLSCWVLNTSRDRDPTALHCTSSSAWPLWLWIIVLLFLFEIYCFLLFFCLTSFIVYLSKSLTVLGRWRQQLYSKICIRNKRLRFGHYIYQSFMYLLPICPMNSACGSFAIQMAYFG